MTDSGHIQDSGAGGGGDVVRLITQARASMKARDYEAAKAGFKNIYDFLSRRGLGEGLEAMECLADLGATHMALKEYDAALSEYARLASIMERNLGEANAELRQHLRRYAQACDVAGKVNEAKQLYSRANDLERRYGAVPARSNAGSLTGRSQSGAQSALSQEAASGGGSTFAEAIQDAVARSMAKLDNRGKPFDPASSQTSKQAPPGPRPFVSSPLPPSPFQNLVSEVTKPRDAGGAGQPGVGVPEQSPGQTPFQSQGQMQPQGQMQQRGQGQSEAQLQAQGQGQTPPQSQGQSAAQPLMPQGFTGSPAMPQDVAIPAFKVPSELSDSQFIYRPKGNAGQQAGGQSGTTTGGHSGTLTGGQSGTSTGGQSSTTTGGHSSTSTGGHSGTSTGGSQSGLGATSSGGMRVSGGQPVAPTPQAKADPEAVQRAIAEHTAAKHAAAQQAEQQAASDFSSGWADSAQNSFPQQAEEPSSAIIQESEVPWADTHDAPEAQGIGESGTHWRAPRQPGTTSGDMSSVSQDRPIIEEGNFEPISGARPNNHQSVEESLDKVFGQNAGPEQERGSSIYADQHGSQQMGPGSVSGEAGNSPVRRTNPSLNSSKLRQMQNRGTTPEPRPGLREDVEETTGADSFNTLAPLGYDPADYDPSVPTHPWAAPGQGAPPPSSDESRRPGAKRATAEWQVDPADDIPESSVDIADPHLPTEAHPDSDSSKAMAQWGVTISDQPEEHYPPIRQDDRRQGLQPVEEATPAGVPKPFDRRQKPKSMKNLRSRFGQIDPAAEVDDAEFAESEVMSSHNASGQPSVSPVGPYEEDSPIGEQRSLPPQTPPRRLADNSITNMTPPELPPDQMLTQLPPEMPPPPPPSMKGRGPRGLLESSGAYAEASRQSEFEPQVQPDQTPPFDEGAPDDSRPSSMISRLVSKRQHDTSMQNANSSFASDELQVPPRIRSMVDAARANISDGKHADAARLMQKVVNDLAEGGLKDSRYVADCMLILSEAYEASGQLGPAITSFHQHALMVEKRVGVKDYESIGNWYRLAVLLEKAGEKDDARTMYEHALALAVQHLDQDDELTASIKSSYEEFLTNPDKATRKPAPTTEYSKEEVLAQNKELRTSALQQQEKPRNKGVVIWSTVSVIVLIAAGFWFFSLMGSMNKSIGNIDSVSTGTIPEQVFANTDGDGLLRFTGTDNLEVTIDGKLRQVKYVVLKNDLSDLVTMFVNASAKQTVWIRKAADGMLVDDNTMFFQKDAPELAMANEMRRIGQRVEEYYQLNRSYPRYRQDWSEDPAFGFINPTTHKGEASLFHVFPKSATQAALFGGSKTPDEIASYLESGETWVGEPELRPCSISVAVKHSGEKANNKPIVQEFFMHATDQNNKYLPASKPKTVSVVLLTQGRNIGNFDLHPQDFSKLELQPMPDGIAYVNMSETPLFGTDVLKSVVPVTFISLAAIFFFGLLITVATLRSNKKGTKKK